LPDALKNLFEISNLKQLAKPLGIRKIDLGQNGGRIFFQPKANIDPGRIIQLIQSDPRSYKLDGQDKLRISKELPDSESRFEILEYLFNEIALKIAA
jgi:transcription-repair coupling factor (superfamily II helicase)